MKKYCIKPEYKHRDVNLTLDENRDDKNYWERERIIGSLVYQYDVYNIARQYILDNDINSVLDIGCGPASKLMKLIYPLCKKVTGIDQQNVIKWCKKKYEKTEADFTVDNFEEPSLKEYKKYELIICSDVIEHLCDPDVLLNYIKRFCNEKTIIIISTPERDLLRGKNNNMSPKKEHVREWNSLEFNNYLKIQDLFVLKNSIIDLMKPNLHYPFFIEFFKRQINRTLRSTQVAVCKLKKEHNISKEWKDAFNKNMNHLFKEELNWSDCDNYIQYRAELNRGEDIINNVEKYVDLEGKKILDIGSGWGEVEYSAQKRNYEIIGLEPFPKMIELSTLLVDKELIKMGSIEDIPFSDSMFDVILCNTILEHVKDYKKGIREMVRVLKPGGYAYLYTPNYLFPRESHYRIYGLFFLPKFLSVLFLKLRGKNSDFFKKYVNPIFSYQILNEFSRYDVEITDISKKRYYKRGLIFKVLGFFNLYQNQVLLIKKNV